MKLQDKKILMTIPREAELFSSLWTNEAEKMCRNYGLNVEFIDRAPQSSGEWNRIISAYDALISSWGTPQLNSELLKNNDHLRIVGHAAGSVADLVSPELFERNIKVTTANDIMAQQVAEWCLTMTLVGLKNLTSYACIGGNRPMNWSLRNTSRSIQNSTIGIWGYGNISRNFIKRLKALRPGRILICSSYCTDENIMSDGLERASLEELFAEADVIALLEGLTQETIGRIDEKLLVSIKDNAVFLNCGRARLVQEEALIKELSKQRFQACLDVHYEEPLPVESELQRLPNVILTPHNAGVAGTSAYIPAILGEFNRFFKGEPLIYEVTRERAESMTSHRQAFSK